MKYDPLVMRILKVSDHLDAWVDTAQIRFMRLPDGPEADTEKNKRDNYRNLARELSAIADSFPTDQVGS